MPTKTFVFCNQKGGAGKTTTTMCVGETLQLNGREVLIVDADPQASAYKWESRAQQGWPRYPVRVETLCGLSPIDFLKVLVDRSKRHFTETGKELDYLLIDTPPNLKSDDLAAALFAADVAVVPFLPNRMYLDAMEELFALFSQVNNVRAKQGRPPLDVRLMVNRSKPNRASPESLVAAFRKNLGKFSEMRQVQASLLSSTFQDLVAFDDASQFRTCLYGMPTTKQTRPAREQVSQVIKELMQ